MAGRSSFNISFIERPLFLGLIWWLASGQFAPAMPLAVFFELFWIDLIPVGGYIPPMPAFPYLILVSLAGLFGWTDAQSLAFPLLISLPLAHLIPFIEARQRDIQQAAYSSLLAQVRKGKNISSFAGRLVAHSTLQIIGASILLFVAVWYALYVFFSLDIVQCNIPIRLAVNWSVLYAIAAIGSLLALRIKPAYVIFILGMVVAGITHI